jgi:outer membrane protein assembly factor BamB
MVGSDKGGIMQFRSMTAVGIGGLFVVGIVALGLIDLSAAAAEENWPKFRGPNAGVAEDSPTLPETWSQTENVVWSIEVLGQGWSSPIVWDDQIFLTSVISENPGIGPKIGLYDGHSTAAVPISAQQWMVYGIDLNDGRIRWEREVRSATPPLAKHGKNSYASETPVTDGERVYAYFGGVGLFAFDLDGTPAWSREMAPNPYRSGWGSGASPVLHKDRLYIVNDNEAQSFIAAFDTQTGDELWRVDRDEGSNWSTPFVWENNVRTEIVTAGTDKVRSYGLDGELLWELTGMTWITSPTPFAEHGLLYISSGFLSDPVRPVYAIRPGAIGDITLAEGRSRNEYIAWSNPKLGTYNTSALVYGDFYYTLLDRGFFLCHDARTGQEVYSRKRIARRATAFSASLWAYNDKIFALSEEGETFVIRAGPEYEVLGSSELGEMTLATPAIADGSLIIRTASRLYRIAERP